MCIRDRDVRYHYRGSSRQVAPALCRAARWRASGSAGPYGRPDPARPSPKPACPSRGRGRFSYHPGSDCAHEKD
eukprot:10000823-Alexandrium_andersonii.AAC.1